jgi:hypothetical protein
MTGRSVVDCANEQRQSGRRLALVRPGSVEAMVVWSKAQADLDRELAHQPLGYNLGFVLVPVAFG